jgi:hypothetical protein
MRHFAVLIAMALTVACCSPEGDVMGPADKCVTDLHPAYNSKILSQCIDVCIKCNNGVSRSS